MKRAARKKRRGFVSLKIVRGTTENTRTLRLPKALIRFTLGFLAALLLFVGVMTYKTGNLSFTYRDRLDDITELENINENQQREIETLNEVTAEVREKLETLEDIEAKVKELEGMDE